MGDRVGDGLELDLLPVLHDGAADVAAVRTAEDAHREFGAPGAHQAGEPDDLAPAHREALVLADEPVGHLGVADGPVLHLEEHLADVRGAIGEAALEAAADHAADDAVLVDHVLLHVEGLDGLAVAQDRDRVGDLLDLVELVADDDRADALALEPDDQVEQVLRVALVQGCGRLVEDQQPDRLVQRLGDLDELLLADADVLDLRAGVVAQADAVQQFGRLLLRLAPVDDAAAVQFAAEEDVLGDGQLGDERELLVDDRDAGGLALADVAEPHHLALVDDVALVAAERVDARQHLHQRRLAGAVLADDRVDLAGLHLDRHVVQRLDAGELLADGAHLEDVRVSRHRTLPAGWGARGGTSSPFSSMLDVFVAGFLEKPVM